MNDEQFWAIVWKIIGGCFVVLTLSASCCQVMENRAKAAMVSSGADPVVARCAFASQDDKICLIVAARKEIGK
jgi:hypothetical protein